MDKAMRKKTVLEVFDLEEQTFDNYVANGVIPPGKKFPGGRIPLWRQSDIQKVLDNLFGVE